MITYSAADLHIHTTYSDGRPSPRAVLAYLQARGYPRLIAITDHDTIEGAVRAAELAPAFGIGVIVGEEVSSLGGHIIGLFLRERIPPCLSAEATVDAIHGQGGIAVAAHPFYRPRRPQGKPELPTMESVGALAAVLPFDAIEEYNGTPFLRRANLAAQCLNRCAGRAAVGASDAHILDAIGKGCTLFPGRTAEDLRCALLAGATQAQAQAYRFHELLRYGHFWLNVSVSRRAPAW